ncbi:collagen-like protein [Rhizobium leguminosarum]|uniref:collagen-like triple helix repeat-containing protein n=1 Tax=Rhizobium leguminosarum TaxID=384 RepID=UPI001C96F2AD|nr:collagen-like protein [Rhizobium leguminosarum]MBY5397966.1 collagen-like protein [Rhizobium leguminosarum]
MATRTGHDPNDQPARYGWTTREIVGLISTVIPILAFLGGLIWFGFGIALERSEIGVSVRKLEREIDDLKRREKGDKGDIGAVGPPGVAGKDGPPGPAGINGKDAEVDQNLLQQLVNAEVRRALANQTNNSAKSLSVREVASSPCNYRLKDLANTLNVKTNSNICDSSGKSLMVVTRVSEVSNSVSFADSLYGVLTTCVAQTACNKLGRGITVISFSVDGTDTVATIRIK